MTSAIVPVLVNEDTVFRRSVSAETSLFPFRQYAVPATQQRAFSVTVPVLVNEDTIYRRNANAETALFPFRQYPSSTPPVGQPFFMLTPKRPSTTLFDASFSVYPVIEAYSLQSPNPNQPWLAYVQTRPNRVDDTPQEDAFRRVNLQTHFSFVPGTVQPAILPYTFLIPDLCDDPWLEQVHRPLSPEGLIFPFRQIFTPPPANQVLVQAFYKAPNWKIEAEPIWNVPATNNQTLWQYIWTKVAPPAATVPNVLGFTLQAALAAMTNAGLFTILQQSYSSTVANGLISAESPAGGTLSSPGEAITLTLSAGVAPVAGNGYDKWGKTGGGITAVNAFASIGQELSYAVALANAVYEANLSVAAALSSGNIPLLMSTPAYLVPNAPTMG